MSETIRHNIKTGNVSDDAHQTLLVDETNVKSNLHQPEKSHINEHNDLAKNAQSSTKNNQKSKISLNDRLIMILIGILGLLVLIMIALAIFSFLHCYLKANHPRNSTRQYDMKTTDLFVSNTTIGNISLNNSSQNNSKKDLIISYPQSITAARSKSVENIFVITDED